MSLEDVAGDAFKPTDCSPWAYGGQLFPLCLFIIFCSPYQSLFAREGPTWLTDLGQAQAIAKKENKLVLAILVCQH